MRLSPLNIIMHKSIIWLQQHRKQHPHINIHNIQYERGAQKEISEDLHSKRLANQDNLHCVDVEALEKDDSHMNPPTHFIKASN